LPYRSQVTLGNAIKQKQEKEPTMIEYLGFIYSVGKDIKDYLAWHEETKVVDREWLEKSGFGKLMESQGYKLLWSLPDKIETRKLSGYEIIFEIDESRRIRRRIVRGREPLVLIGKRKND
jgi:hypothetical protein